MRQRMGSQTQASPVPTARTTTSRVDAPPTYHRVLAVSLVAHLAATLLGCGPAGPAAERPTTPAAPTAPTTGTVDPAAPPRAAAPSPTIRPDLGEPIHDLTFAPDGNTLAVATDAGEVVVYSWPGLQVRSRYAGDGQSVSALEFRDDGAFLAVVYRDISVRVLRTRDGAVTASVPALPSQMRILEFLGASDWLAVGDVTASGTVHFVNVADAQSQCAWQLPAGTQALATITYDGSTSKIVAARYEDPAGHSRSAADPCDASLEGSYTLPRSGGIDALDFFASGGSQLLVGTLRGALLMDPTSLVSHHAAELSMAYIGVPCFAIRVAPGVVQASVVTLAEFQAAQAESRAPTLIQHVWNLNEPRPEPLPVRSTAHVLAVHPSGRFWLEADGHILTRGELVSEGRGAQLIPQIGLGAPADIVDVSSDGTWALSARRLGDEVLLWDVRAGALVARLPMASVSVARFTSRGDAVVAASLFAAKRWDVRDMRLVGNAWLSVPGGQVTQVSIVPTRGVVMATNERGQVYALMPEQAYVRLSTTYQAESPDGLRGV